MKPNPRLNYYVDCSHQGEIPYMKIPVIYTTSQNYIYTRADFAFIYGQPVSVTHPKEVGQPNAKIYKVSVKDIYAKPHKTSRLPEAILTTILTALFIAFLFYTDDMDVDLHQNICYAALGISFIFGLFFGSMRIYKQATAADKFNKS